MDPVSAAGISFLAGLFAPLGAVCVLPLYPGFLAWLANQAGEGDEQDVAFSFCTYCDRRADLFIFHDWSLLYLAVKDLVERGDWNNFNDCIFNPRRSEYLPYCGY